MSIFEFDMQHLDGKRNVLADALSRIYKNPEKLPPFTSNCSALITTSNNHSNYNRASTPRPTTPSISSTTSPTSPTTSSTSTNSTKMLQFVSTTVNWLYTKCNFNLCSSCRVSAVHYKDYLFDENDLQYQLERDLAQTWLTVTAVVQALQKLTTSNYQPPIVKSNHDSNSDIWEHDLSN